MALASTPLGIRPNFRYIPRGTERAVASMAGLELGVASLVELPSVEEIRNWHLPVE